MSLCFPPVSSATNLVGELEIRAQLVTDWEFVDGDSSNALILQKRLCHCDKCLRMVHSFPVKQLLLNPSTARN